MRLTAFDSGRLALARDMFGGLANVEVCEFGQGVSAVLAVRRGSSPMLPPKGLIVSALAEACRDIEEDNPFHAARNFPGFHRILARSWEMVRSYQVELPVNHPQIQAKTAALASIYSRAEQILIQLGRRFNADAMAECPETEPEDPGFTRMIVLTGSEYRPAELEWLTWLASTGIGVDLVAERHAGREPSGALFPTEGELFAQSNRLEARFGPARTLDRANPLARCVFSETEDRALFDCEILETPDMLSECEWVLREAHRRCDVNYSSVAIFCRSLESYGPLLQSAADRLGVPLSMGRRFPLLATSMGRTIIEVLRVCASPDVRDLTRLARTSYFAIECPALRSEFESACRLAYREGPSLAWKEIETWARQGDSENPRPIWLIELLEWRAEALRERVPLEEWRERLKLLSLFPGLERLAEDVTEAEPTLVGRMTIRDQQAVTAMLRSLAYDASVDRISRRRQLSLQEFVRLAHQLWEHEEVTLEPLPGGIQVVHSAASIGEVETLFVMGMLEGEFPRRRTEDALFTDAELALLSPAEPIPNSHDIATAERDEFYRACCAPSHSLVLTYPRVDEDRDNVPAFYLEEIKRVTGITEPRRFFRTQLTPEEPQLDADVRLKRALAGPLAWPPTPSLVSEAAQELVRGFDQPLTPREIADAYECPFRYYAGYRLKLSPSQPRLLWGKLNSIPIRAGLAEIEDVAEAKRRLRASVDEQLGLLLAESLPHDYRLMQAGANRLLDDWVDREFQARQLWPRDQVTTEGINFSEPPLRGRLKLRDGRVVELRGSVPAVSKRGDMDVVHLYRGRDPISDNGAEGEAKFHPHDQLEMALFLLMRSDRDRPAGVEIDHGRGRRLITVGASQFPRQDVKSEMRSTSFEGHERSELLVGMVDRIQIAVDRIQSGDITPTPEEARCHFCDFGELCRRSHRFSEVDDDPFRFEEEEDGIHAD